MAVNAVGEVHSRSSIRAVRRSLGRVALAVCSMAMLVFAFQASGAQTSRAHADYCQANGGFWNCFWGEVNLAPQTRRFFQAENTLRNWLNEEVADGHGGTVSNKCANIMRGSDGAIAQVACGGGQPFGWVPASHRPGYVFIVHSAGGARTLFGAATH